MMFATLLSLLKYQAIKISSTLYGEEPIFRNDGEYSVIKINP